MRYVKVSTRIWHDEKVSSLGAEEQRVFFYLLTCPHGNLAGIYVLRSGYAAADLNTTRDKFEVAMKKIVEKGLAAWDCKNDVIYLPTFSKFNAGLNTNQKVAVANIVEELPRTPLLARFIAEHPEECAGMAVEKYHEAVVEAETNQLSGETKTAPRETNEAEDETTEAEPETVAVEDETPGTDEMFGPFPPVGDEEKDEKMAPRGDEEDATKLGKRKRRRGILVEGEDLKKFVQLFREECPEHGQPVLIDDKRAKKIREIVERAKAIVASGTGSWPEEWIVIQSAFKELAASAFHRGENDRKWWANFDYIIRPDKFDMMVERAVTRKATGKASASGGDTVQKARGKKALSGWKLCITSQQGGECRPMKLPADVLKALLETDYKGCAGCPRVEETLKASEGEKASGGQETLTEDLPF